MKIMRRHSWIYGCLRASCGTQWFASGKQPACRMFCLPTFKENRMTWEKPQAVDMRWGFEITMYIANR